jgi:hypothetical protein
MRIGQVASRIDSRPFQSRPTAKATIANTMDRMTYVSAGALSGIPSPGPLSGTNQMEMMNATPIKAVKTRTIPQNALLHDGGSRLRSSGTLFSSGTLLTFNLLGDLDRRTETTGVAQ